MRPRKQILIVDSDASRRSAMAYMLYVQGLGIHQAETIDEAESKLPVDLVLMSEMFAKPAIEGFFALVRSLGDGCPCVAMMTNYDEPRIPANCDRLLPMASRSSELVAILRVMVQRKRGPRKGTPSPHKGKLLPSAAA